MISVFAGGAINFARSWRAGRKPDLWCWIKTRGARVVKKLRGRVVTLDFSDFRGKSLEEDLRLRDFTINSLAVGLDELLKARDPAQALIDPCGGRSDISRGLISSSIGGVWMTTLCG